MRLRLLAAAALFAGSAHAWSRRTAQDAASPSLVRAKLDGPTAVLTARFVVTPDKDSYNQALYSIELPAGAMVTAGSATIGGTEHALVLTPADAADEKFGALSLAEDEAPAGGEHRSAVLISGEAGAVTVSVAAAHGTPMTLELTAAMPTCFYRDARYIAVPVAWQRVAELSLRAPVQEGIADACDPQRAHAEDAWISFPARELTKRASGDRIGAFAGRVALGDEHIARIELDLSAELADVPRDLATVILVDGSRSMTRDQLEVQRQVVASYLQKAPGSRVQVLAFARGARPLLPGWTTAAQAAGRVDRELRALAQRNGSNFDVALTEAARWLQRIEGTRRVILVTDERMAERLESMQPVVFRRLLPEGTLVHVVVTGGATEPARFDDAHLAPLAAATDGMAISVGTPEAKVPLDMTLLARPISVDEIAIKSPGWTRLALGSDTACDDPGNLFEGEACTWWGEGDASSGQILVEGLVWGKRVQRLLTPDLAHARDLARELTTFSGLAEPLQERAAQMARAVDHAWSLYAEWGGPAKYATGSGFGMSGGCACGGISDTVGTMGHGTFGVTPPPPELEEQLRPLLAACRIDDDEITVRLEMTLTEIVDVGVQISAPSETPPATVRKQQRCVEDALWDAAPMLTFIPQHDTFQVTFRPVKR